MPPQDPVRAFTPEVRLAFEAYLNEVSKSGKALMNATKRAQYLHFLANPEQKIYEITYPVLLYRFYYPIYLSINCRVDGPVPFTR